MKRKRIRTPRFGDRSLRSFGRASKPPRPKRLGTFRGRRNK